MNAKFYDLPQEKRQKMMNAGFRVFAQNSYKNSPMQEIADEAGVSKALLFHYFRNKQELYLFLWEEAARITIAALDEYHCYEPGDFFDLMDRGLQAKLQLMAQYPEMSAFAIKAYYETDPDIRGHVAKSMFRHFNLRALKLLKLLNPANFRPGLDLKMMYREMFLAAEGFVWEALQRGGLDAARMEKESRALLAFWRKVYGADNAERDKESNQEAVENAGAGHRNDAIDEAIWGDTRD